LTTNILLNGATNIVEQYRAGLGDINDKIKNLTMSDVEEQIFSTYKINYGGRKLIESDCGAIKMYTIDDLNLDKLDFIKIDVQGFEENVINGGINTIKKCNPIIFFEDSYNKKTLESRSNTIYLLRNLGYTILRILYNNNEDCIAINKDIHIEELKFINNQSKYIITDWLEVLHD